MEAELTLLLAARRMDPHALASIFDLYASALYRYALHLSCDPHTADQVVGDVFAKFLDQLASGKGPCHNLRSYLFQAVHNLLVDEIRYAQRRVSLDVVDGVRSDGHSICLWLEDQTLLERLLWVIEHELTPDQRHVIVLRFLEGFSIKETANIVGKSANAVKVTQNRAVGNLRKALTLADRSL